MTGNDIFRAMSELDDELIVEARARKKAPGRIIRIAASLAAAAAVLALVLIPGGVSVSVDGRRIDRGGTEVTPAAEQVRAMSMDDEPAQGTVELYASGAEGAVFSVSAGEVTLVDAETGEVIPAGEPCTSDRVRIEWSVAWPGNGEAPEMTVVLREKKTVVTLSADEARQVWIAALK